MKQGKPLERKTPMKRSGFKAKPPAPGARPKSRRPLSVKSDKRAAEDAFDGPRSRTRTATHERSGYRCVARHLVPSVPCGEGVQCDEFQGRGREPGSHLDDTRTQSLCTWCHMVKTTEPRIAGLIGLYGPEEQQRRLAEEGPGALEAALNEFARRKAQVQGYPGPVGGSIDAEKRFAVEIGTSEPEGGW